MTSTRPSNCLVRWMKIELLKSGEGQLERIAEKEREARICGCYKFALKLLIAKSHESNPARVALWCRFLAQLVMQPKHRIICVRMAIKTNLDVKNYGVAARFINMLIPLNLACNS